jgi:hypothetical protein
VDTSQNVGIGTTSIATIDATGKTLEIYGGAGGGFVHMTNSTTGQTVSDGFIIGTSIGGSDALLVQRESANMIFRTADTERMRISSAGVVTAPYQPCFHAYRTTTQTGTNPFTIIFDTAPVNVGSSYSTSTGRFTAPVTGNYFLLFYSIGLASAWSTFIDIYLYKNGSSTPTILSNRPASTNGSEVPASLATSSAICNLTAGDYVEIKVMGTSIYSDGNAWLKFMGFLIG